MKFEITNERPVLESKMCGEFNKPIEDFIKSDKKYIVFTLEKRDCIPARNKIYAYLRRNGYNNKIASHVRSKDKIVYLEKIDL